MCPALKEGLIQLMVFLLTFATPGNKVCVLISGFAQKINKEVWVEYCIIRR